MSTNYQHQQQQRLRTLLTELQQRTESNPCAKLYRYTNEDFLQLNWTAADHSSVCQSFYHLPTNLVEHAVAHWQSFTSDFDDTPYSVYTGSAYELLSNV